MHDISLLLTLFVLLIDSVPVCFKTLTLLGEERLYEQIQGDREQRRFRRYATRQEQLDILAQVEASTIVADAQMDAKLHRVPADERARRVADVEREVTELLVPSFRAKAMEEVPDLVGSYVARRRRMLKAIRSHADEDTSTEPPERRVRVGSWWS